MKKSDLQFTNPRFGQIYMAVNENFEEDIFEGININTNTSVNKFSNEQKANVVLNIKIGKRDESCPFYVECELSSDFTWNEDSSKIDSLLESNAPALLLSYSRPYISMLTASTSFPAFNIPFMNFSDNQETEKDSIK